METTFAAVLSGKLVRYPMSATFVVERRKGPKADRFISHKETISQALTKFHRAVDENKGKVHLRAVTKKGRFINLQSEG